MMGTFVVKRLKGTISNLKQLSKGSGSDFWGDQHIEIARHSQNQRVPDRISLMCSDGSKIAVELSMALEST